MTVPLQAEQNSAYNPLSAFPKKGNYNELGNQIDTPQVDGGS